MVSYEIYKLLHVVGIVLLFSGLVALLTMKITNVNPEGASRRFAFLTHGLGLFLLLLSGFGLLARLEMARNMPNWAYVKIAIWLIFGGMIALIKRRPKLGWTMYIPMLVIYMAAAYLAINKPF
jgi:uncharacterized membrane protein SirB2